MPKKKPLVVVTRRLPDIVETRMRELFDARLNVEDRAMSQTELAEAVKMADVSGAMLHKKLEHIAASGADCVVTPVSSNSGIERCGRFARVVRTRIGSPYVIEGMSIARAGDASTIVGRSICAIVKRPPKSTAVSS